MNGEIPNSAKNGKREKDETCEPNILTICTPGDKSANLKGFTISTRTTDSYLSLCTRPDVDTPLIMEEVTAISNSSRTSTILNYSINYDIGIQKKCDDVPINTNAPSFTWIQSDQTPAHPPSTSVSDRFFQLQDFWLSRLSALPTLRRHGP